MTDENFSSFIHFCPSLKHSVFLLLGLGFRHCCRGQQSWLEDWKGGSTGRYWRDHWGRSWGSGPVRLFTKSWVHPEAARVWVWPWMAYQRLWDCGADYFSVPELPAGWSHMQERSEELHRFWKWSWHWNHILQDAGQKLCPELNWVNSSLNKNTSILHRI